MPRTRQREAKAPAAQGDPLDRLTQTVARLEAELRCLRETLDRVQDELDWMSSNDSSRQEARLPIPTPMHITSLPRNPLAPDFGERINKVSPEQLSALREQDKDLPTATLEGPFHSDKLF